MSIKTIYHKRNAFRKTHACIFCDWWCHFLLVFPRLAKLLFQWNPIFCIQRRKGSSGRTTLSAPQLRFASQFDKEKNKALKILTCSHSQENILAKQGTYHVSFHLHMYVYCIYEQAEIKLEIQGF